MKPQESSRYLHSVQGSTKIGLRARPLALTAAPMVVCSESFRIDTPLDTDRHELLLKNAFGGRAVIVPGENPVSSQLEIRSAVMLSVVVRYAWIERSWADVPRARTSFALFSLLRQRQISQKTRRTHASVGSAPRPFSCSATVSSAMKSVTACVRCGLFTLKHISSNSTLAAHRRSSLSNGRLGGCPMRGAGPWRKCNVRSTDPGTAVRITQNVVDTIVESIAHETWKARSNNSLSSL